VFSLAIVVGAALLAALGATPAAGNPASSSAAKPPPPPGAFTVKASNGYSLFVVGASARQGRSASIVIFVTSKTDGAFYSAPATVTETSLEADLGVLGEIAVTFHPSGQARTVRSKCGGKPVSYDDGSYEGTIAFHGEESYTAVEASAARGDLGFLIDIVCPGISGSSGGPFLPGAELNVEEKRARFSPHLKVVKNHPGGRAHFEASISEKRSGVSIERFTSTISPARTFTYDDQVQTATVRPPDPFSGTAHFRHAAKPANRWTGDLTVDFPGKSNVKLTGGDLRVSLVHARWDWSPPTR
jgi:hypothetical protein